MKGMSADERRKVKAKDPLTYKLVTMTTTNFTNDVPDLGDANGPLKLKESLVH